MTKNEKDPLWGAYAKTVRPLKGGKAERPPDAGAKRPSIKIAEKKLPRSYALPVEGPGKKSMRQLDRHVERRLNRGHLEIDARLDLHGFTQAEAYERLEKFLERGLRAGRRTLLVVTGKGTRGKGILRERLAGWLAASEHANGIIGFREAAPRDGGAGAFYVLLRRQR